MPETAQLAELTSRRQATDNQVRDLRIAVDDLTAEQKKADRDVESVKARRERDQSMVDSGSVKNPKDIERMLHELTSLDRRISDLEDVELEVMERLENAQQSLDERTGELASLDEQIATVGAARDKKSGEIDAQLADTVAERTLTVDGLPEDLLALYEKLREQKGGVGAAALRAKQCGGCRLTLDASILGEIAARPSDDVVRCEECGRILVRTGESGL